MTTFSVYNEDWQNMDEFSTLEEAQAHRYQEFGYAGYIIEYDDDGNEIANHS